MNINYKPKTMKPETTKKVKLTLVGLNGNAYALMGAFQRAAREQGWKQDEINAVLEECKNGDYDHLLVTLMEHTEEEDDEDEWSYEFYHE